MHYVAGVACALGLIVGGDWFFGVWLLFALAVVAWLEDMGGDQ